MTRKQNPHHTILPLPWVAVISSSMGPACIFIVMVAMATGRGKCVHFSPLNEAQYLILHILRMWGWDNKHYWLATGRQQTYVVCGKRIFRELKMTPCRVCRQLFMEINDFVCKMSWIYFNYLYLKYGSQTISIFANPSQTIKIFARFARFRLILE